ncbi:hypothetical protein L195_g058170 [Trifolium pratense]|uniref:Uncharacterized protein n=1 Tax=Trifolium pratense TaxID=57577 RepID=A0A2K3JQQ2_TRIPR|nr:hypothetical protein L195_g058170 [Trifolium pratense]
MWGRVGGGRRVMVKGKRDIVMWVKSENSVVCGVINEWEVILVRVRWDLKEGEW